MQINGQMGEGGGAVLRTSLSLSALTGRPFVITDIRANRSRPGLRPQHLTAVRAAAAVCRADLRGDHLDSTTLAFHPQSHPQPGDYQFDVVDASASGRSAGAVTLIIQTLLWPLIFAGSPSTILIRGGTFVPFSPPFHYLAEVAGPAYARFGVQIASSLARWGWITAGGGSVETRIGPVDRLQSAMFHAPTIEKVCGVAAVTNLPSHIPQRMAQRAYKLIRQQGIEADIQPVREKGDGPGAGIVLWVPQAGFSSLGRTGLPAEKVAEASVAEFVDFKENEQAVDRYLADQILVPMSLAEGRSGYTTSQITQHTITAIELMRLWLGVTINIEGAVGEPGAVEVIGAGYRRVD